MAFPSISSGAYGYPLNLASTIAVSTVREFIKHPTTLNRIVFVCFSPLMLQTYLELID